MIFSYAGNIEQYIITDSSIKNLNTLTDDLNDNTVVVLHYGAFDVDKCTNTFYRAVNMLVNDASKIICDGNVDFNFFNVATGRFDSLVYVMYGKTLNGFSFKDIKTYDEFVMYIVKNNLGLSLGVKLSEDKVIRTRVRLVDYWTNKTAWWKEKLAKPLVIILTKNLTLLEKCLSTIDRKCFEVVIAFKFDKDIYNYVEKNNYEHYVYDYEFNYSKINDNVLNIYSTFMDDYRYAILLNDDVETDSFTLTNLLIPFYMDDAVAVTGCPLLYPNGLIQHAGVTLDKRCGALHAGRNRDSVYLENIHFRTDMCVTFALVAIDIDKYFKTEGFDENLPYDFNDIDYCLECKKKGYKVLYNPELIAIHYESQTRKLDDRCGVKEDIMYFKNKHKKLLEKI